MINRLLTAMSWLQNQRVTGTDDEGQGTIEYVLVLGVLVVGIFLLADWVGFGPAIQGALEAVVSLFTDPNPIG